MSHLPHFLLRQCYHSYKAFVETFPINWKQYMLVWNKTCDIYNCKDTARKYFRYGGISVFATFSAILQRSRDKPVVTGGGNRRTRRKPPPNPKSLATFSHALESTHIKQHYIIPKICSPGSGWWCFTLMLCWSAAKDPWEERTETYLNR